MNVAYVNFTNNNSRDRVTIRGLKENGVVVTEIADNRPGWKKFSDIKRKLKDAGSYDIIIVGYTAALLVPWIKLISRKPITYNALASFYESMVVSRKVGLIRSFKYYAIDYLAFRSADLILVESRAQKEFISRKFRVNPNKISVHLTGVDDKIFHTDPAVQKLKHFTVLFRGKFLPEAGVDIVLHAAKKLENSGIHFRIMGHGLLEKEIVKLSSELQLSNVELITTRLSDDEMRQKMLECHVSLGQAASHPRLERTIPHKAFEALAMKLPYLTGRNKGVLELLTETETCLCFNPGDPKDLADKILYAKDNSTKLETIAMNGYTLFSDKLTTKKLGGALLEKLRSIHE